MNLNPKDYEEETNASNSIEAADADGSPHQPSGNKEYEQQTHRDLSHSAGYGTGERGIPQDLSNSKKSIGKVIGLFALGSLAVCALGAGTLYLSENFKKTETEQQPEIKQATAGGKKFPKAPPPTAASEPVPEMVSAPASAPEIQTASAASPVIAAVPAAASEPEDLRLTSPLMFNLGDSQGIPGAETSTGNAGATGGSGGSFLPAGENSASDAEGGKPSLASRLSPSNFAAGTATLRGNVDFLLGRGTGIPCSTQTRIVTTHPGVTKCQVTDDVYSANGKVLLIERGSVIHGEQQSALLNGQARVFVAWTTLETPNGVTVSLDSLGADPLGGSGHPAYVKHHFWKRMGGAIMISMIEDVINAAGNRRSGSSNVTYESTTESAQNIATEILKNNINIPPTGYVNQGERIMVFTVRDVDFSKVYELVQTD